MIIYLLTVFLANDLDLSLAGKRQGMSVSQKDGGTRSGLLWEVERILDELSQLERERDVSTLPQILLMENVPQVICPDFEKWQLKLESLGYKNYVEILNAKDYGIPQNRKRCFMISILGDYNYSFPKKMKLKCRLCDLLEKNVDEKYYLDDEAIDRITKWNAYEKPLENLIDVERERESNRRDNNPRWKRQCRNETCEDKVMFSCDYRYDEGIRGREDYNLCPTLTTHYGGYSGMPLVANKKLKKVK